MSNAAPEPQTLKTAAFAVPIPTVGRIVHYQKRAGDPALAAIVTEAWGGPMINLTVFDPKGSIFPVSSVRMGKPGEANCWCWPPRG